MSLFGTFADVSLPDVISLIGNGSGRFIIRQQLNGPLEEYELSMESGHISRMSFNGQEIHSSEQAHSFITELIRDNRGEFEFQRGPIIKGSLWIHITEALLSSVSILDEMAVLKDNFPDPHTVFLVNDTGHFTLRAESHEFWSEVESYFRQGICAVDLSERLGIFVDQIQLKIYKLQLAKAIAPKRAFYKTEPLPFLQKTPLEKAIDLELQTLAKKLEPIWQKPITTPLPEVGKKTVPLHARQTQTNPVTNETREIARPDFSSVKIYRPDKKTMGGFMNSIKKIMRAG